MMNEIVKNSIKFIIWDVIFKLFTYLPINQKKVFFESFLGKSYSDNPKALYEELNKSSSYHAIWSVKKKQNIPGNAKQVKRLGLRYLYHLATAKYIIVNSRMPKEFVKADDQILIQTWHGTPLKKLANDIEKFTMPNQTAETYLQEFDADVAKWDYLISQNAYSTKMFKSAFKYEKEIIEIGYPRNDYLLNHDKLNVKLIKEQYGIKPEEKVLLYAPTYRDNQVNEMENYIQTIKLDLEQIQKRASEWKIIIRVHYLIAEQIDINNENVIVAKEQADINDLMIIADCLLTDYSSVMFDYANLKRPIIFYAYDLKEYEKKTRGFYQDYKMMICGKNIKNTNDLIKILKNFNNYKNQYTEQIEAFHDQYAYLDDGKVSERIINKIFGEI